MSRGKFGWWPKEGEIGKRELQAFEVQALLRGGNPERIGAKEVWRRVGG